MVCGCRVGMGAVVVEWGHLSQDQNRLYPYSCLLRMQCIYKSKWQCTEVSVGDKELCKNYQIIFICFFFHFQHRPNSSVAM